LCAETEARRGIATGPALTCYLDRAGTEGSERTGGTAIGARLRRTEAEVAAVAAAERVAPTERAGPRSLRLHGRHGRHVHRWLPTDVSGVHIAQQADLLLCHRTDLVPELIEGNVRRGPETLCIDRLLHLLLREREFGIKFLIHRTIAKPPGCGAFAVRDPVLPIAIDRRVRDFARKERTSRAQQRAG